MGQVSVQASEALIKFKKKKKRPKQTTKSERSGRVLRFFPERLYPQATPFKISQTPNSMASLLR